MSNSIQSHQQLKGKIQQELSLLNEIEQHEFALSIQNNLQSTELKNNSGKRDLFIIDALHNWIKNREVSDKSLCNVKFYFLFFYFSNYTVGCKFVKKGCIGNIFYLSECNRCAT